MPTAKVLIVEDDQFIRDLYTETLTGEGYIVDSAVDGEEGLTKIKQGSWDLVLLDIVMPKLDGLGVMRALAKDPDWKVYTKHLVFLTNLDKDEEIKEALTQGEGYIIKSQITPGDMVTEVAAYLAKPQLSAV